MIDVQSCIKFLQKLICQESLPGQEEKVAKLVAVEMKKLHYDEVFIDEAGNVIGLIRGQGVAPAVMLNTHLDHVDVGEQTAWPHPPFAAEIHRGRVWGRGAMDIKGPLAAQVYGVARLKEENSVPPGDVYVSAVVQEEVGGFGARHLMTYLRPPLVVVGEATDNQVRRGHRGRTELILHVSGRSVHASVPQNGVNPLEVIANFIQRMTRIQMKEDPVLGTSSVAPTLIWTDQSSPNVIPADGWLTCDWRRIPSESKEEIRDRLQELANQSLVEGARATVTVPSPEKTSFTGLKRQIPADGPPFLLSEDDPALRGAISVLSEVSSSPVECGIWKFATDGGHFAEAGLKVIGFGPGEEALAHTVEESIRIADLETAMAGNHALAARWALSTLA